MAWKGSRIDKPGEYKQAQKKDFFLRTHTHTNAHRQQQGRLVFAVIYCRTLKHVTQPPMAAARRSVFTHWTFCGPHRKDNLYSHP